MLHNKYYGVLKQYLGDYGRETYGRKLVGKVNLSQKGIALALVELEKQSILKSRKQGPIKLYSLNGNNTEIKSTIAIVELMRKEEFLSKSRALAHLFRQDSRIVGIFGSYAKGSQKKDSDIDIFVIGKKKNNDYDLQGRKFNIEISIKYFSASQWAVLCKEKNNLCREIVSNHVLIFGAEKFIEIIWSDFYGYN